jgi:hypothetical protein
MPNARIGKPRRHLFFAHGIGNRAGERPHLIEADQRHHPDFPGPMATLAVILKDWQ